MHNLVLSLEGSRDGLTLCNEIREGTFNVRLWPNGDMSLSDPKRTLTSRFPAGFKRDVYRQDRKRLRLFNRFEPTGLSVAPKTQARFLERISRLYEQGADEHRIGQYVRRFNAWAQSPVVMVFVGNNKP